MSGASGSSGGGVADLGAAGLGGLGTSGVGVLGIGSAVGGKDIIDLQKGKGLRIVSRSTRIRLKWFGPDETFSIRTGGTGFRRLSISNKSGTLERSC